MLQLIADDCHHEDLSHEAQARNKEVKTCFLRQATGVVTLAAVPLLLSPSVGSRQANPWALPPTPRSSCNSRNTACLPFTANNIGCNEA